MVKIRDRDRSWAGSHHAGRSVSAERGGRERSQSGTRSENGFMLGRGSSRLRDFDGTDETSAKTYITITPGQPTRIRAQSPSKSAKLSCDETVTSARERSAQSRNEPPLKAFDLNRSASPSPQRKHSAGSARNWFGMSKVVPLCSTGTPSREYLRLLLNSAVLFFLLKCPH